MLGPKPAANARRRVMGPSLDDLLGTETPKEKPVSPSSSALPSRPTTTATTTSSSSSTTHRSTEHHDAEDSGGRGPGRARPDAAQGAGRGGGASGDGDGEGEGEEPKDPGIGGGARQQHQQHGHMSSSGEESTRNPPTSSVAPTRNVIIGPCPVSDPRSHQRLALQQLPTEEEEARWAKQEWLRVKGELPTEDDKLKRPDWMLSIPKERTQKTVLGKPRQFRKNSLEIGDSSVWTDTPADKARKAKEREEGIIRKRIPGSEPEQPTGPKKSRVEGEAPLSKQEMEAKKLMDIYNRKYRSKSLVEEYSEKVSRGETVARSGISPEELSFYGRKKELQKKADDGYEPYFDRERDLQSTHIDQSLAHKLVKEAGTLNSRFSASSTVHFD
ncbi:hypothetical protein Pelo_5953 [Pelomyxa schiedti]|nr:hypothetical protein Pelo_5953 [Pelomyxa schiedti]